MDLPEHSVHSGHSVSCSSSPFGRDAVCPLSWNCHLAEGDGEDPVENVAAVVA